MKTRAELDAMSHQELKDYEQSLLALWTPRMAIESDIERLILDSIVDNRSL